MKKPVFPALMAILSLHIAASAQPAPLARSFKIEKKYLNIPVQETAAYKSAGGA